MERENVNGIEKKEGKVKIKRENWKEKKNRRIKERKKADFRGIFGKKGKKK